MHFFRILVDSGSRLRWHRLLDGIDSIKAFKPAKDSGSNFQNFRPHEDLTTFIIISSAQQFW